MKNYILLLALSITLTRNPTQSQLNIAKKYNPYFRQEIIIEVKDELSKECLGNFGCTWFKGEAPFKIEVAGKNPNSSVLYNFEHILLHEIFHYVLKSFNEQRVDSAAYGLQTYVNNQLF